MYAIRSYYVTNLTNIDAGASVVVMGYTVNLYEAKTKLSSLVEEAAAGTEIVIAKAGNVITSYSIHYTKLYDQILIRPVRFATSRGCCFETSTC